MYYKRYYLYLQNKTELLFRKGDGKAGKDTC